MNWQHTAPCPTFSVQRGSDWKTQWETEWVIKWARVPASPPGCSCCPTSAPSSPTEPHKRQLQLSSVTITSKIDENSHMDWFSWPLTLHTVSWILYLSLGPNGLLLKSLCTYLWRSDCKISIRLQPSSSVSMYANQNALPYTFRGLWVDNARFEEWPFGSVENQSVYLFWIVLT